MEASHAVADSLDYTGRFMTECQWSDSFQITIAELLVVRAIATADTSAFDSDLQFADSRGREISRFLPGAKRLDSLG
jgi:hypothetical protein